MTYDSNFEHMDQVRSILHMMDRSIDAARTRRENPNGTSGAAGFLAKANMPIANPRTPAETGPPRLPTSMFDRSGPRLKARPKRTNNDA